MHSRHPEAAKKNGSKGGRKTASQYKDGSKVWALRMAYKRWHGVEFDYAPGADEPTKTESQ